MKITRGTSSLLICAGSLAVCLISNNNQNQIKQVNDELTANNTISTKLTDDPTTVSDTAINFFASTSSTGISGGTVWITLYDGENPTVSITCCSGSSQTLTGNNINLIIPSEWVVSGTPYTITGIREYAFIDCTSLESINIPSSVSSIEQWAFMYCSSLKSVTFEGNSQLKSIEEGVFFGM